MLETHDPQSLQKQFSQGHIFAYPTEAVFGLGCDPDNEVAVMSLLALKQRPLSKNSDWYFFQLAWASYLAFTRFNSRTPLANWRVRFNCGAGLKSSSSKRIVWVISKTIGINQCESVRYASGKNYSRGLGAVWQSGNINFRWTRWVFVT